MKNRQILPAEFDIGSLLNNDEVFELARKKLRPETMLDGPLKSLVQLMVEHGNSIDTILKFDKSLALYAMELSNYVSAWTIKLSEEGYESLKQN